jgi:CDGSH-type Zn-finger protein
VGRDATNAGNGHVPEVVVTPYRDGPLLVRGPIRIQDQDGQEIVVEREVVALCRCGKSRTRPLCDGTHKLIRFRAPSGLEDRYAARAIDEPSSELRSVSQAART